jgi:hypothetical protein
VEMRIANMGIENEAARASLLESQGSLSFVNSQEKAKLHPSRVHAGVVLR